MSFSFSTTPLGAILDDRDCTRGISDLLICSAHGLQSEKGPSRQFVRPHLHSTKIDPKDHSGKEEDGAALNKFIWIK